MNTNYTPIDLSKINGGKTEKSTSFFLVVLIFLTAILALILFFMIQSKGVRRDSPLLNVEPIPVSSPMPTVVSPTFVPTNPVFSATSSAITPFILVSPTNQATQSPTIP